jgi:hypothetical protein
MRERRLIHVVLLTLPIAALAVPAAAQVGGGPNEAGAAALFEEAKKLLEKKQYSEACPKFLQSYEFDRTKPGALYAHAECLVEAGKIGSAVSRYEEYVRVVDELPPGRRAKHYDRKARAKAQMTALEPDVPELTIVVPSSAPPGTRVVHNGEALGPELLNRSRRIDPGEHLVMTEVPGEPPVEERLTLRKGEKRTVMINVRRVVAPPTPPVREGGPSDALRAGAYAGFGVGAMGLVVGAVTGAIVFSTKDTVDAECSELYSDGTRGCTEDELADVASGRALGTVSIIAFGVGLAGAAAGTVMTLARGNEEATPGSRPYSLWRAGGYGALGAGGAGLVLGAITGVMVLGRKGAVDEGCDGPRGIEFARECNTTEAFQAGKGAQALGTLSTVAFGVGAVGLAAGAGLLFLEPSEPERTAARRWVAIGPTSLSLDRMEIGVQGRW